MPSFDIFGNPRFNSVADAASWERSQQGRSGAGVAGGVPPAGRGLAGAEPLPGTYNPASGGIPGVTSPGTSMENLISSITNNIGGLGGVVSGLTANASQALKDQYGPAYQGILDTAMANTQRRASGDISDLVPLLQQNGAEWAVRGGIPGSAMANTKLLRDLGLTQYQVERDALTDLGKIHAATPVVAPFDVRSLVPDIGLQTQLQQLADTLRAAGVPEAVYQRTMADIAAGLRNGQSAGYGGGFRGPSYGFSGGGNSSGVDQILNRYGSKGGSGSVGGVPNPVKPGWGDAGNGFTVGEVPGFRGNAADADWEDYFADEWAAMTPVDPWEDYFADEWAAMTPIGPGPIINDWSGINGPKDVLAPDWDEWDF